MYEVKDGTARKSEEYIHKANCKWLICDELLIKRYYVTYYVRYKGHWSISTDDLNRKKKERKKSLAHDIHR